MNSALIQFAATVNKYGDSADKMGNVDQTIVNIINAVIGVIGLVCVIVMIIGGVQYMTSTGDPGKVEKGKKTILYGLIGLIICVLSFAIVNFAIDHFTGSGSSSSDSSQEDQKDTKKKDDKK